MPSRSRVHWDSREPMARLARAPALADAALGAITRRGAATGERDMKSRAPWTDRTGNARQGLVGRSDIERRKRYAIVLAHTVSYGIWLEVAHGGRYRVIDPTLPVQGERTMREMATLFARIFGR